MPMGEEMEVEAVRRILWGDTVKEDVFRRWSQGFHFSDVEPSALVQNEGGPCAVIAPLQAFILKILLQEIPGHCFPDVTVEKSNSLLVRAACEILEQCVTQNNYRVAYLEDDTQDDLTSDAFHARLNVRHFDDAQHVRQFYVRNFDALASKGGVLLLLYSVMMSKGTDEVQRELSDPSEPLIHAIYGHGSQGLINLMLTGRAVGHVWDDSQNVGGLRLSGIDRQSQVGFVTIMEHMQYCTVGSHYKNPKSPVWLMGSETHLTVLFSFERRLVSPETPAESARRIFRAFDPDGDDFVKSELLRELLSATDLVSEPPEYVDIMRKKLDAENLGIILLNAFMDEFFSGQQRSTPDTFELVHYNGLPRSNAGGRVIYRRGNAVLLESELRASCDDPMLTCLQTKWPGVEVCWIGGKPPSLN